MKRAIIVAGLAFGDEGKGATVDFLTHYFNAGLIVRYNGGSQTAHNVVTPDGKHHTFAQFGSGMFHPGVRTHLSRFMLVNPENMLNEAEHLEQLGVKDALQRTTIDALAPIITPFHKEVNRILERARGDKAHGTCGQGIGQCRSDHLTYGSQVLLAGDLLDRETALTKLRFLQDISRKVAKGQFPEESFPALEDKGVPEKLWNGVYKDFPVPIVGPIYTSLTPLAASLKHHDFTIFEGAQGVLLDETYGFFPHVTWTDTTFNNALTLLDEARFEGKRTKLGVVRSYYTRHGAGPFPTEDKYLSYPEPHNGNDGYQGKFRLGSFDYRHFEYAVRVCNGIDAVAVNHLDVVIPGGGPLPGNIPVWIGGYGPTHEFRGLTKGMRDCFTTS